MKYFKRYEEVGAEAFEVTEDEAKHTLSGWWKDEFLEQVFNEGKAFRLFTPFAEVWTKTEDGLVPQPGFYGTVG